MTRAIPTEIIEQIVSWSLRSDPSSIKDMKSVSRRMSDITNSNKSKASYLLGKYDTLMVYNKTMKSHPQLLSIPILKALEGMTGMIPKGFVYSYSLHTDKKQEILSFLQKKNECTEEEYTAQSDTMLDFINRYAKETKEGRDGSSILEEMKIFIQETRFIPAYFLPSRAAHFMDRIPLALFEHDPQFAKFLVKSSIFSNEDSNTHLVCRLMWEYGYVRAWSSSSEQRNSITNIMKSGDLELNKPALKEMIRRSSWVDWSVQMRERADSVIVNEAAQEVVTELLKNPTTGGYASAMRIARSYQVNL